MPSYLVQHQTMTGTWEDLALVEAADQMAAIEAIATGRNGDGDGRYRASAEANVTEWEVEHQIVLKTARRTLTLGHDDKLPPDAPETHPTDPPAPNDEDDVPWSTPTQTGVVA